MKRRTFAKIVGGMLLCPVVKLEPQRIDPHRYLGMFCDKSGLQRFDFASPFALRGHVYASDALVLVRVADRGATFTDAQRRLPKNVLETWDKHILSAERRWRPLEPCRFVAMEADNCCPLCTELPNCPACDGEGEVMTEDDAWSGTVWCSKCCGHGVIASPDCPLCQGRFCGHDIPSVQRVGNKLVSAAYYGRLSQIPGVELNYGLRASDSPILFRSDVGISGIVMPMVGSVSSKTILYPPVPIATRAREMKP